MARTTGGRRFVSIPDVVVPAALTLLRAADEARVGLVIVSTDAAVGVRLGDDLATATRGARLGPGASATITATGAVYAFSEGAAVTLSLAEELS